MPSIFLAHGSPMLLDDGVWVRELHAWAGHLPRPAAVLMLSAHWEDRPVTLGATDTVPLVYDFYGFPAKYYDVRYPAPGAPALAASVRGLLGGGDAVADATGARHSSDLLAAGSEASYHLTRRAVKRVGCHELDPRPRH